jgi:hypothetical protein
MKKWLAPVSLRTAGPNTATTPHAAAEVVNQDYSVLSEPWVMSTAPQVVAEAEPLQGQVQDAEEVERLAGDGAPPAPVPQVDPVHVEAPAPAPAAPPALDILVHPQVQEVPVQIRRSARTRVSAKDPDFDYEL